MWKELQSLISKEDISVPNGVETLIRINDVNSKDGKEDIKAILESVNTASGLMLPKI